jgi:ADP-ribose pyrophosphatase YjhB (NUDIX family)
MLTSPQNIRVSVRAVILHDGAILLSEYDDESGLHYNLPGGGVENGEGLHEALIREVREETGMLVRVGRLLYAWEYVPQKRDYAYGTQQTLALIFACDIVNDSGSPSLDPNQTAARWIALSQLPEKALLPPEVIPYLTGQQNADGVWLGGI